MASPRLLSLSRILFTKPSTFSLLSRSFSSTAAATTSSRFSLLSRLRPLSSVRLSPSTGLLPSPSAALRTFATRQALSDNSSYNNRPPKETILLDGCDFEHWLVVTDPPPPEFTRDDIIQSYIKTLAEVVGSEEEARMKIYSVSTKHYFAFGALVSEELSYKLKELKNVRWVLPDSYLDVKNKDYGGEPFINGQAVPYDPKYHEEWVRNNQKAQDRNRRNDRPRNADRSRNFERRQRPSGFQNNPNPAANAGRPEGNMGGMPNQPGGHGQNMPPNNAGYGQNMPPNNAGYGQNMPPNNAGYGQNMPPNNAGYAQNMPPSNAGYGQHNPGFAPNMPPNNPNNMSGPPPGYGGQGNPGYPNNNQPNYQAGRGMPYQNTQVGNQQNYPPPSNTGGQPGGGYPVQDVPGRDVPQY